MNLIQTPNILDLTQTVIFKPIKPIDTPPTLQANSVFDNTELFIKYPPLSQSKVFSK